MAVLTVQQISRAGLDPSLDAAAAAGDSFPNSGRVFLRVANAHLSSARTVTVVSQLPTGALPQGAAKTDLDVSVPADSERWIGPLDPAAFNDTNPVTYSTTGREVDNLRIGLTAAGGLIHYKDDGGNFTYVTEVLHEGFSYPGTALLALRGSPGPFLSGGSLRVTCVAKRARLHDPRTDDQNGARDLGSSQNAALAIRDLITSSEGEASERFGAGSFFAGSDLFVGTDGAPAERNGLIAFADFCDAWVHRPGDDATLPASATNGERRCRLNSVLDTPQSLMETVGDLAFVGYCFASLQGSRWRFPLDQDGDSVFTFVDDVDPPNQNMSKFVLRLDEWGKSPTGIQGSFWNEALNHERDELLYPVDGLPENTPTNVREVDLRGVTRETEAARMLRHLAEQARALPFPCSWEAHPGIQHVEAGDIVTVQTRVPYSTGTKAMELKVRILAGIVGRDDDGRIVLRFAGRVMRSSSYTLHPVTVPVSAAAVATRRTPPGGRRRGRRRRRVSNLRARVR